MSTDDNNPTYLQKTIYQLFEEQVVRTPNNVAIFFEKWELTYQKLNEKSNQLAYHLRSLGVGTETLVAIAVERSFEMVIGLLAILKAGGAYVPLDPSYPEKRLSFLLEDTKAEILLTQPFLKERFKNYQGHLCGLSYQKEKQSILIENLSVGNKHSQVKKYTSLEKYLSKNLPSLSAAHNLAYVIYTSGSTGKPKGVTVEHKSLCHLIFYFKDYFAFTSKDHLLSITMFTFDIFGLELYLSLISGAKATIASQKTIQDSSLLTLLIKEIQPTFIQATPSTWKMLVDSQFKTSFPITILSGGEHLPKKVAQDLFSISSSIWNAYGPTETTIWSSCNLLALNEPISIGKPISNTQIYILDDKMNLVPINVTGEIYIGGIGLARGYLNRPDLTAEKFLPNLFKQDRNNLRLYRTGDLARYLPNGSIEFLGRIDEQVKIRGFRIECEEINSVLSTHADISSAVVVARDDDDSHKKLVAYFVLKDGKGLTKESTYISSSNQNFSTLKGRTLPAIIESLRNYLITTLPDYMIPSFFVVLDKMPITSNGKLDKRAFPAPNLSLRLLDESYVDSRTSVESDLVDIWSNILRVPKIGIHDNFFKMGGDSLLATQIISRIRSFYKCNLSVKTLFEAPTIAELAAIITQILNTTFSCILPLVPQIRPIDIPLSFAQQRLWFLEQFLEKNHLYNIPVAFKLSGSLKITALEQAFNALVQRHESLRTFFLSKGGEARQIIAPKLNIPLIEEIIDPASVNNLIYQEAHIPFDLAAGPLLRVKVLRLSTKEHILLITLHHIISDEWSMEILFQELSFFYKKYLENQPNFLTALPIQYADFAIWQRKYLKEAVLEKQLLYWKNNLANIPELLTLPTDYPRPKELSYEGGRCNILLSTEIQQKLHLLSQSNNCSLFMILLAALQIILKKYSGQNDIVVGSPIANRTHLEVESLIGFFVNTLALRTTFAENQSFLDILTKVKETTLQAYQHQDLPFEQLVGHLKIPRALNYNPVFQVLFVLQNVSNEVLLNLVNLETELIPVDYAISKFDLTIAADESQEGIKISIDYLKDIFEGSTIKSFVNHFEILINEILKDPTQLIDEILILTPEENQKILINWNDTQVPYSKDQTVYQLFEAQAAKTPNNIAIVFEDQEYTYQQLNEKSNKIARYLRSLGVGAETLVAIAIESSLEMIIGLLGVLKAGGAYVPLDLTYPEERLSFLLEDTNAKILLTQPSLAERFKNYQGELCSLTYNPAKKSVCVARLLFDNSFNNKFSQITQDISLEQYTSDNLPSFTTPQHLAYVIYTSGSTGKPKGVGIQHGSLTQYLQYGIKHLAAPRIGKSILHSSIAFDMSITTIFISLVKGNILAILPTDATGIEPLIDYLKKNTDLNFLKITPSHLKALKNHISAQEITKNNNSLIVGGEALLKEDIEAWSHSSLCFPIINEYGPTEATVGCCVFILKDIEKINTPCVPIGKPISNTQIYILDNQLNPVPINVPGEIYIGGDGLARGYLNRPELTAEKFLPNPFIKLENHKETKHLRLYRTGDLARYLSDGNIEFLGRIDDQVKIRGFRIECKEIESILNTHGDVTATVVLARNDDNSHKKLVAYIVPGDFTPSSSELREYLEEKIPDYMIPSFFILIDKIPLTPNGKIDKKALPIPDLSVRLLGASYVAPRTPVESDLGFIWSEILRIPQVGIHDNFFRIGGHSLLATQIISRIRRLYNCDLSLKNLFESPTIAELAVIVNQILNTSASYTLPLIIQPRFSLIPLSFAQQRLWFLDQLLEKTHLYNISVTFKLSGSLKIAVLEQAFNVLIQRHESLRTIFPSKDGEAMQAIIPTLSISLKTETVDPAFVNNLIYQEAHITFDLAAGPLLRVKVLRLSTKEYILLITLHHIICDGWSMEILFKELSFLYKKYVNNEPVSLTALPLQYADFAIWQRKYLKEAVLEKQLLYWKNNLANAPELLTLPTDYPRPQELSYEGGRCNILLSTEIQQKLHLLSQSNNCSLFMILLAALQIILKKYSGQNDIVVGSPIANRNHHEIENLIGFFVNTLALRTTFAENQSFLEVLNKVKETTLQAFQHQDLPFEQLVDHLEIPRVLNYNPVFQVLFVLQNASNEGSLELVNLKTELIPVDYAVSKFDLTVAAEESREGIKISIDYLKDIFEGSSIKRFFNHFEILINEILKDPARLIDEISILTPEENQKILIDWNDTQVPYSKDQTVYQLFEAQAAKTPNNIAIVFEDQEFTYQQLNEKSNKLARYLRSLGVGAETLVAIAIESSLEMIIGLLGVLKAGGAYVPLDLTYPEERLSFLLEDINAKILLTQPSLAQRFKNYQGELCSLTYNAAKKSVCVARLFFDNSFNNKFSQITQDISIEPYTSDNLPSFTTPQHLAYVIYTSGSTGKPKGVSIQHGSLTQYLQYGIKHLAAPRIGKSLLHSSIAFDMSITTIFISLVKGNILAILPTDATGIEPLIDYLKQSPDLNFLKITPSHLKALKNQLNPQDIMRHNISLIMGGEVLLKEDIANWIPTADTAFVINHYGPTETTVGCCVFVLKDIEKINTPCVPIGKPISNTQIYILDNQLNPVPINVPGEIYIGGDGLARGYLNRPELTAEKFLPNPFIKLENHKETKHLRLYRTGDLARYLSDGNIEFLGRIDDQVKIRGFRIECKEIESILNTHGDVTATVVLARNDDNSHKKLVAYIVPGDFTPSSSELREYLEEKLPDYMIPSFFILIDKIPLTPNGKIDKKALPIPDLSVRLLGASYVAPRTSVESDLGFIWSEILRIPQVGIHDNFFRIGGHSLLATQIISRIRRLYNCDLSLKNLFESPTIAELAVIVNQILNIPASYMLPLIIQPRSSLIPLSFAQQRLWFLDQLLEKTHLYNISVTFKLSGSLKIAVLEQAFNDLIQRHESLRTIFPSKDGEAMQVIIPSLSISLKTETVDPAFVNNLIYREAHITFDLAAGPLLRVKVLRLSTKEYILLITLHHIICDGWSMEILFKELSFLYKKYVNNEPVSLTALPIQYADFAIWQRKYLKEAVLEKQLLYWKNNLVNVPELLTLPTDYSRPKELSYEGGRCNILLSTEIQQKLHLLSQSNNCSLFMILLAALQIILKKYSGQNDIVVGSPIANRNHHEIENLIGFFVNTLALRTTFVENQSFLEVLNKVKETTLQAFQHQDLPFEQLVDHLEIPRVLNYNPVFQVLFVLQNASNEGSLDLVNLKTERIYFDHFISKFDLTITAEESREGIKISIDYLKDIFEGSSIKRFFNHFEILINEILKDPARLIDEISILTPEENQKILIDWNDTQVPYSKDQTVYQLFEAQAAKTPNNIAIVFEDQEFTYQQLNEKSNKLARYLRSLGVGAETLVAIAIESSLEMIIGLLGVLKAGGAYVPLDLTYPEERLSFLLEDTNAKILLTQPSLAKRFKNYQGELCSLTYNAAKKSVCVARLLFDNSFNNKFSQITQDISIEPYTSDNLPSFTTPQHLAYVIYTSGSTGKPKGVGIQHGSLTQYLQYGIKHLAAPRIGKSLLHSSIAFDMSITTIFISLVKGNILAILPTDATGIEPLIDYLKQSPDLNFLKITPSHLKALKNQLNPQDIMRHNISLIMGGEVLLKEDIANWIPTADTAFVINHYGPTETTVGCCVFVLNDIEKINTSCVPIGKPISNTQIYILDNQLNPVPINVPGEIYIGGDGLARGYLNRPELTAEKFLPNPFIKLENYKETKYLRLYRTGDLARYLTDGNIEFLGRIDDQVKIRGFRIECKEIESVLNTHGDVASVVVLTGNEDNSHKKLVAYVVPGEFTPSSSELREYLEEKIPDYMIPSFFIFIDKLPLTPNGKLDKKALPSPELSARALGANYVAPRTPSEFELAAIWSEVLRIPQVGIYDNFFRIGGDSIISIQLMARARKNNLYFNVRDIFQYPTIAELASITKSSSQLVINVDQGPLTGPLPLLPIQHWFFEQHFPHINHFNQSILLKLNPSFSVSLIKEAFLKILSHHDLLRAYYKKEGPSFSQFYGSIMPSLKDFFIEEDLSSSLEEDPKDTSEPGSKNIQEKVLYERSTAIQQTLNIEDGLLVKVALFYFGPKKASRLLIAIHHLVVDGVSWRILLNDLQTLLSGHVLPTKTHSYRDWGNALLTYASSETLLKELSYWKEVENQLVPLITDINPVITTKKNIKTIKLSLSQIETTRLIKEIHHAYRTEINDILLTALVLAMGDWKGSYELTLFLEGHGREDIISGIDLSQTVGWFTSIFPVTLKLITNDLGESIKTVKEQLRCIPHKGIGYGILKYLNKNTEFSASRAVQSLKFNYLGQWDNTTESNDILTFASEESGLSVSSINQTYTILNLNADVKDGVFHINLTYSMDHYYEETIKVLSQNFSKRLKDIIDHCSNKESFGFTASDFNLVDLEQIEVVHKLIGV